MTDTVLDDPSACVRGRHCTDVTLATLPGTHTTVHVPARATWPRGLCRLDVALVRAAVDQAPADYAELTGLLGKSGSADGTPVAGTRALQVPIRLPVEAAATELLDEIERQAVRVAARHRLDYEPGLGPRDRRVLRAAELLLPHLDTWLVLPGEWQLRLDPTEETVSGGDAAVYVHETGLDGALRLLALHERVRALAGRVTRAERMEAPCPSCGRRGLERQPGSSHIDCLRCGHRLNLDQYEDRRDILTRATRKGHR